jgi:hypothetical protein
MSTPTTLYDTIMNQLLTTLPSLPHSQLLNLALLVATAAETQHGQLGALARALPLETTAASREQRLRRFLANQRVTQATHYRPLIRHALTGLAGQTVRVLIDRVDLTARFQLLVASAAFRRRSVPLAWTVLDHEGSTGAGEQIALVAEALSALPTGVEVILHGDGEFRSTELFAWARTRAVRVMLGLSESTLVFTSARGAEAGRSIADCYGPRRTRPLPLRGVYITEARYGPVNVLIWWTKDQDGERIRAVGTDLRGDGYSLRAGRTRMWIETLFGDWQSRGFALDKTGLMHAARLERLLLGLALAYVLLLSLGRWVVKRGLRRLVDDGAPHKWKLSLFGLGVSWLEHRRHAPAPPALGFYLYC